MTTYYCDLGAGTLVDRDGSDGTTNVLTGPAGFQAAIRGTGNATPLAAGDTLLLKGTGDFSRLVMIDCNAQDVTGWGIGDHVRNKDGDVDDWTGVITQVNYGATDRVLVWLAAGKTTANIATANGIENTDAGGGAGDPTSVDPITSKTPVGVVIDTNLGTVADGHIKIIGTNSSFVADGTRAVLQGNDENRRGIDCSKDRIWLENLEFHSFGASSSYGGLYLNSNGCDNNIHTNLYFHDCNRCVSCADGQYVSWFRCIFDGGDYGIYAPGAMTCVRYCKFVGQTTAGMTSGGGEQQVIDCLFVGCAIGISMIDDVAIHGCTFIGVPGSPAGIGVDLSYGGMTVMAGCRFCYLATGVSIDAADSRPAFLYCYFGGNTADLGGTGAAQYDIVTLSGAATSTFTGSDTDQEFVNPGTGDFNLATGATYRSVAVELD